MSAILPPKPPRRTPLKLSLPGSPNPDAVGSGSGSKNGPTPPTVSLGAPALSIHPGTPSASSTPSGTSKPSLKLAQLSNSMSNLSLAIPDDAGPSRYGASLVRGPGSSSEDETEDDDDDEDRPHRWRLGEQERMAGELLDVIRGPVGLEDELSGRTRRAMSAASSRRSHGAASRRPSFERSASGTVEEGAIGHETPFDDSEDEYGAAGIGAGAHDEDMVISPGQFDAKTLEISPEKLQDMGKLGEGASGQVRMVRFKPTGMIMAKKTISTSPDPKVHKQHLRELLFMRDCSHPGIVQYYGAYLELHNTQIDICMEYCEAGSLDSLYKKVKGHGWRTGEKVLGKIAESMISGLVYLHSRKIIHRDIKPSNVLVTIDGQVKLCDFGVSGELVNSMASTWIGTSFYLSPERIKGGKYSITSDVWSMAVTVLEVALNRYPFPGPGEAPIQSPVELLIYLTKADVAQLDDEPDNGIKYTNGFRNFIQCCLDKDPATRPSPQSLMTHGWIRRSIERQPPPDLARWVRDLDA